MTNNEILISVIVPIYNAEKYLTSCVDSIINQTYKNLEIILVNDGSSDKSSVICDDLAQKDNRVKVVHKQNEGLVRARKIGIQLAKGDYIAYVDNDDLLEAEMYETMVDALKYTGADIIIAGYKEQLNDNSTEIIKNTISPGVYSDQKLVDEVFTKMLYNSNFSQFGISTYLWNKLFKKDIIYKNQMNVDDRISLGEDAACLYPSILDSKKICITDTYLYNYRQHISSMMKTKFDLSTDFKRLHILYEYLKNVFQNSCFSNIMLPQVDYYLLSLATVFISGLGKYNENDDCFFPYSQVKKGSKIVLCGAGNLGQHLFKRLLVDSNFELVKWIDANYIKYSRIGLPVYSTESLIETMYDYVVVAYINKTNAENTKKTLLNLGVPENKIAWLDYDFNNPQNMLKYFGLTK